MNELLDEQLEPFLYVVVCAAGVAGDVGTLITMAQDRGWGVGVVATPQGLGFIDAAAVQAQTGYRGRAAVSIPLRARASVLRDPGRDGVVTV